MSQTYFTILTNLGATKLAESTASGTQLKLTHLAVGDGNGNVPSPLPTQTQLINEVRRSTINTVYTDENNENHIIIEQVIPPEEGGFYIRELGVFDDKGNLIAVGNCPPSYKPKLSEGSGRTQVINMVIMVDNTGSVELKIDASTVLATRKYVDELILSKMVEHEGSINHHDASTTQKGFVKLNNNKSSTSTTEAATISVVNEVYTGAVKKIGDTMSGQLIIANGDSSALRLKNTKGDEIMLRQDADCNFLISKYDSATAAWTNKLRLITSTNTWRFENVDDVVINNKSALKVGDGGLLSKAPVLAVGTDLLTDSVLSVSQIFTLAGVYVNSPNDTLSFTGTLRVTRRYYDAGAGATLEISHAGNVFYKATAYKSNGVWKTYGWVEPITTENISNHLPVGIPQPWPTTTVPKGWIKCNGATFDKTMYPKLAAAYPSGKLPDLRGEFIRGFDDGRGVDNDRVILSSQGDTIRNITGKFTSSAGLHSANEVFGTQNNGQPRIDAYVTSTGAYINFDASRVVPTSNENRPRNIAFLYIVKAE